MVRTDPYLLVELVRALGFLNADAAIEITKETGQAANTIVF